MAEFEVRHPASNFGFVEGNFYTVPFSNGIPFSNFDSLGASQQHAQAKVGSWAGRAAFGESARLFCKACYIVPDVTTMKVPLRDTSWFTGV